MESMKRNIIIATMVAMFLAAVEGTVVTIAVPTIIEDLNGFGLISWVFSSYLLTSAVTTPIYGKLADLYGRKNTLTAGIAIFLVGSFLCGLSQNIYSLIMFRALQGIGAGSIFTITYTIVGDVFSISERAKVQGWLSTVWGIASLIGPFFGGFLIDTLSWHWIFFINIPFGVVSIALIQKNLQENFEKRKRKIDYLGAVILTAAIVLLLYGFLAGGDGKNENIILSVICIVLSLIFLILFYFKEKKSEEPIVPFEIFTRLNIIANIISFLESASLMAIDVYVPLYIQNVLGFGATISGLCMSPMSFTWLLSSIFLAKCIEKYREKYIILICSIIVLVGSVLMPGFNIDSSLFLVMLCVSVLGFGFGGNFTTLTIVVQSSVGYFMRGAATASNSLLRNLGQTIGISVFGSIFNLNILRYFNNMGISGIDSNNLYSNAAVHIKVPLQLVKESLNSSLYVVFIGVIVLNVVSLLLSLFLPKDFKKCD
jgi:EmrB/QacA subfamily drug resistance transporter